MDLIPRDGVVEIVGHRDRAVALYEDAFKKIQEAQEAVDRARAAVRDACGGKTPETVIPRQATEVAAFENAVKLPDGDQYMRVARRLTDAAVWAALIERTDLGHLMDVQAKEELRSQMEYVPERTDREGAVINQEEIDRGLPPVTVDAVLATLEGFAMDAQTIWRRGLANSFSKLDRRFRSHDGFGIGSRIILTRCFNFSWGPTLDWNYTGHERDTLQDIERVFLVLDGKGPRAAYAGIVGAVDAHRTGNRDSIEWPVVVEGDYFRLRAFKNGNAHLWFTRDDLVKLANKELAEYYGDTLGYGRVCDDEEREQEEQRAVGHAKGLGFYATPEKVAHRILSDAYLWTGDMERPLRILEPSAGTGALVRAIQGWQKECGVKHAASIDCVEINEDRAKTLEGLGVARVQCWDFLNLQPAMLPERMYDRVIMNPPFDRGRDIDHVLHAFRAFLKPGGRLVAIMSASTEFRQDRKTKAFRALMEEHGARWRDLPAGSFAPATNVNTLYVAVTKPTQ